MDGLIFVLLWLGGASIHTIVELLLKKQSISTGQVACERRQQTAKIDKGAQGYE
jgi:hypothetical protein